MHILIFLCLGVPLIASDANDSPSLRKKIIEFTRKLSQRSIKLTPSSNNNNNAVTTPAQVEPLTQVSSFPFYSFSPCVQFFLQQQEDLLSYVLTDAKGHQMSIFKPEVFVDCKFQPLNAQLIGALSTENCSSVAKYSQQPDGSFQRTTLQETIKIQTEWNDQTHLILQRDIDIQEPHILETYTLYNVLTEKIINAIALKKDMRFSARPLIHEDTLLPIFMGHWENYPHRTPTPIPWSDKLEKQHHLLLIANGTCLSYISFAQAPSHYTYSPELALIALLSSNKRLTLVAYNKDQGLLNKKSENDLTDIINEDEAKVFSIEGKLYILTNSNNEEHKTSFFALKIAKPQPILHEIIKLTGAFQLFKSSTGELYFIQKPASIYNFSKPRTIFKLNKTYLSNFDNPQ